MRAKILRYAFGVTVGLALCAAPARADYPGSAPVRPFNLPDLAGLTAIDLDAQFTWWEEPLLPPQDHSDITDMTLDLAADISLAPHWVIVVRMPFVYADIEDHPIDGRDCCGFGLGNLTLGARALFSNVHGESLRSVIGGEFNLSLATASDDGDDGIAAVLSAFARAPHDPGRYLPNTWTPRLLGHAQLYGRWLMVQVEAGLHFWLYDDDVAGDDDSDVGLRLALAAGVRFTTELALLAEINTITQIDDDNDNDDDDTVSSLDVGIRYGTEAFVLGLRVYIPLDEGFRDRDMLGVGVDLGARF
jgi:hypothetical protein